MQAHYLYIRYTGGAGALYSTIMDLYKWDRALYTEKPVTHATKEKMFTPFKGNYGYGWFIREEFGHKLIEHRGGINGFLTMIQRFVDDDIVIITLFNYVSTFAREATKGLAAIALGEKYEPILIPAGIQVSEKILQQYAGVYKLQDNHIINITIAAGKIFYSDPDLPPTEAIPQTEKNFYIRPANALVQFIQNDRGEVEKLILRQSENVFPCLRIK